MSKHTPSSHIKAKIDYALRHTSAHALKKHHAVDLVARTHNELLMSLCVALSPNKHPLSDVGRLYVAFLDTLPYSNKPDNCGFYVSRVKIGDTVYSPEAGYVYLHLKWDCRDDLVDNAISS